MEERSLEELWRLYPIVLKSYNPQYPLWYAEEKQRLLRVLRDQGVARIHHIGSTAVEGLTAKPTIDILLEFPAGYAVEAVARRLQEDGWILMQKNVPGGTLDLGKGYLPTGFADKVYHLHVKPLGDWGELYFRDYLRQHPEACRRYEALKRELKERFEHNRDAYTMAKTDFVREHTEKARREVGGRYRPPEEGAGV